MTEKEKLREEIHQIIDEHHRKSAKWRKIRMLCGGAGLLLLFCLLLVLGYGGDGQGSSGGNPAELRESIVGTYEIEDVDVLDMFDFPGSYYDMGDCVIRADGSIEFSCYDGSPDGEGQFEVLQGTVKPCDYVNHDFEIVLSGSRYHNLFLDRTDSGIRIHVECSYRGGGYSLASRKIDYYYQRELSQ